MAEDTPAEAVVASEAILAAEVAAAEAAATETAAEAAVALAETQAAEAEIDAAARIREWQEATGTSILALRTDLDTCAQELRSAVASLQNTESERHDALQTRLTALEKHPLLTRHRSETGDNPGDNPGMEVAGLSGEASLGGETGLGGEARLGPLEAGAEASLGAPRRKRRWI